MAQQCHALRTPHCSRPSAQRGDGTSTFNVPDLQGRAPVGAGQGAGLSGRALAARSGAESYALTINDIPSHGHGVSDPGHRHFDYGWSNNNIAGQDEGAGWGFGSVGYYETYAGVATGWTDTMATGVSVQANGGNGAHSLMQPFAVVNMFIKT
jgi:microcystin-dependent protein